jgi:hypothetical protein
MNIGRFIVYHPYKMQQGDKVKLFIKKKDIYEI